MANEVAADRLAGLYAGSNGLDKRGIIAFFRDQPKEGVFDEDGTQIYLGGDERAREFEEGYAEGAAMTKAYLRRSFEYFVRDLRFDLRGYVRKIVERFK